MRTVPLLLAVLCIGQALAKSSLSADMDYRMIPFSKGHTFSFQYNAQIASGLIAQDESSLTDPQQKALTRIQCQAEITFGSDRHAKLQLQQIKVGQLNEKISNPTEVKPMSIFEQKQIPQEKLRQLQMPCYFSMEEGVIERVQFQENDDTWSKNIKRGLLNMVQLNLNRNNDQGLRTGEESEDSQEEQDGEDSIQGQLQKLSKTFNLPEITVEGACQTSYTINQAGQSESPMFNVTKSINYKRCSKIADVAYGFQAQQQQPQCAQCQMDWFKQQLKDQRQNGKEQQNGQHPCAKCDPKEVKEQQLDRSTTLRYVLVGKPEKYALKRTELLSQYVWKNMKAQTGTYGSAMHTVVAATLQLRNVQKQTEQVQTKSSDKDETLMFSNQEEVDVKRFYMLGDEEFPHAKSNPFHGVPKMQQAQQALRKLLQASQDKQNGFEVQSASELQRLVESLRMCTVQELKRIDKESIQSLNGEEKQKAKHWYIDALAIAGTRNCIQVLVQKIQSQEISQSKAVQALKNLNQLPAPSDAIVQQIQRLCKSQKAQQQPALKQSCWLTFGALVNEICQHKTQQKAQQTVFGAQSGFNQDEVCPQEKKKEYKEEMLALYANAKSTYEKVVALSTLGNAGIDTSIRELEKIIKDKREERVVRVKAIDALRRMRTQMPRKIQQILLPIFQNNREQPPVRTAAFAILMYTLPEQQVVDQLCYAISKERNSQVKAFTYRTMKMMSRSKNPSHQQIAKHIKNALKLTNVDEQQLRYSGKFQIPIFSQEQQEGIFVSLASMVSPQSALPAYAHAQIDSVLNDQFKINEFKLFMMQQEAEQWYEGVATQFGKSTVRAQRRSSADYGSSLRNIYNSLGIKSRRSSSIDTSSQPSNRQPFAMLVCRTNDVDHGFISMDDENMPQSIRQMVNGETKPTLRNLLAHLEKDQQLRVAIATSLSEKETVIPTSCGLPLRASNSISALACIEGNLKVNPTQEGLNVQINAQPMINLAHIQKMECQLPFLKSGVESVRSIELNIPVHAELSASQSQGLTLKVKLPRDTKNILGAHSVPYTYTAKVQPNTGLVQEPHQVRVIHNSKLERMQRETNKVIGNKNLGVPLHINAHYHWPSQPLSYQQFFQMLMATENAIHIVYQPNAETPREAIFHISGQAFQTSNDETPQMQSFYTKEFEYPESSEEYEDMQLESHSSRRQKLDRFIGQYQPSKQYKHALKMSAKTVGGPKECKAECQVQAHCDSKLQFCRVQLQAERTPMNEENKMWTLKAQAQLVMPETVSSVQEMEQLSEKNDKFQCKAEANWGAERKQQISLRVQGESAKRSAWRQLEQQQQQRYFKKRMAFLNKFDLDAEYSLNRNTQNALSRCIEMAKSYYFWNTETKLVQNSQGGSQQEGKVHAQLIIDPITTKHANFSMKTPTQLVRLTQIELPAQCRPFSLVHSQNAQSTHSFDQLISRISLKSRPECTVDGLRVETFDDVEYNSPLSSNCYSVLAKDCSSEQQPRFAVLMKAKQSNKNGQKKLKVITPEQTIQCEANSGSQRIQCKVDGQTVDEDDQSDVVNFNNYQKTDITVHVPGVSVRFNGRKAWLKISPMYKNRQCGLCGHYDDSEDDEWRSSDNELIEDLAQFHRSYTLNSAVDDEQCSESELNQFYEQHDQMIRSNKRNQVDSDEQSEDWDDEEFDGDFDSSEEEERRDPFQSTRRHGSQNIKEPEQKTKVKEMDAANICFSVQPVKQCPRGTVPSSRPTSDYQSEEEEEDQPEEEQSGKIKKVQFACISRSSAEARRLLNQLRNGWKVVDVSGRGVSFTESVREPTNCRRI